MQCRYDTKNTSIYMSIIFADLLVMSGSKTPLAVGHRLKQLLLDACVIQQTQAKCECKTQFHSRMHDINFWLRKGASSLQVMHGKAQTPDYIT